MPATYKILQSADHADSFNNRDAFALDVLVGLSSMPKSISSKYFYDQRGSELFRQISLLPEYYLTERELEIIEHHWSTVAAAAGRQPFNLVELGAGFSQKSLLFLEHFAVELIAQAEGHHDSTDFMPVAVAQQIAAVAFERVVFEEIDLGWEMGFRIDINSELIAVIDKADDLLALSADVSIGQAAQGPLCGCSGQ